MTREKQTWKRGKEMTNIEFATTNRRCTGDGFGTSPKGEEETCHHEQHPVLRRIMGKAAVLIGLSAGIMLLSGYASHENCNMALSSEALQDEAPMMVDRTATTLSDAKVMTTVEQAATFPGGDRKLMEWISRHLIYPASAIDDRIQGKVVVKILIKSDGSIGDAKIVKKVDPALDKEALRVVKTLPPFNPATVNGKPVDSWYTLPVTFKLAF